MAEGEKRDHYLTLASLASYVLIEQSSHAARVYCRGTDGEFTESLFDQPHSIIALPAIEVELRFEEIYAGIKFADNE